MPNDPAARPHRIERVLGVMAATVIGISVIVLAIVLVLGATGVALDADAWTVVRLIPFVGLPIGVLLILALLIVSAARRTRAG